MIKPQADSEASVYSNLLHGEYVELFRENVEQTNCYLIGCFSLQKK